MGRFLVSSLLVFFCVVLTGVVNVEAGKRKAGQNTSASSSRKRVRIVLEEQSNALFNEIKAYQDIPFKFLKGGCTGKAHTISYRLHQKGVPVRKIWIFGDLKPVLNPGFRWNFHVAPLVSVQMGDGTPKDFVLDPTLADRLLSVEEWLNLILWRPFPLELNLLQLAHNRGIDITKEPLVLITSRYEYLPSDINSFFVNPKDRETYLESLNFAEMENSANLAELQIR